MLGIGSFGGEDRLAKLTSDLSKLRVKLSREAAASALGPKLCYERSPPYSLACDGVKDDTYGYKMAVGVSTGTFSVLRLVAPMVYCSRVMVCGCY